jgi:hypothetical protein
VLLLILVLMVPAAARGALAEGRLAGVDHGHTHGPSGGVGGAGAGDVSGGRDVGARRVDRKTANSSDDGGGVGSISRRCSHSSSRSSSRCVIPLQLVMALRRQKCGGSCGLQRRHLHAACAALGVETNNNLDNVNRRQRQTVGGGTARHDRDAVRRHLLLLMLRGCSNGGG